MDYRELMLGALDSATPAKTAEEPPAKSVEPADSGDFDQMQDALRAAVLVQQWAEDDELEDGETVADRLFALCVGMVDEDKDGEISAEEMPALITLLEQVGEYLLYHGADDDDVSALLNDWDDATAERVRDVVMTSLPEDGADDANAFTFGDGATEAVFDAASYRAVAAVRDGKRVMIKKRIAGTVRLSGAQKSALKEARRKAQSSDAKRKRAKSMRLRRSMNLKPVKAAS